MLLKSFIWVLLGVLVKTDENNKVLSNDFYALAGGHANLTCPLQNESKSVFWDKNATSIFQNGTFQEKDEHRYKFLDIENTILQIIDVIEEDFVKFQCYTGDTFETYSMQLHKIEITIHTDFFNNSLFCNATGWPDMVFLWEHLSEFHEHIRYLNASDSGRYNLDTSNHDSFYQHNGDYVCIVKSKQHGTLGNSTKLDVNIPGRPVCVRKNEDTGWIYGSIGLSINLEVLVYSVPTFHNISWLKEEYIVKTEYEKYKFCNKSEIVKTNVYGSLIHLNVYSIILTIESLKKADLRNYTAHIVNTVGECYCTVEIRIEGSSNSAVTLYLIACSACVFIVLSMNIIYRSYKRLQTSRMNRRILSPQMMQITDINEVRTAESDSFEIGRVHLAEDYCTVTDSLQTGMNQVPELSRNAEAPIRRFVIRN